MGNYFEKNVEHQVLFGQKITQNGFIFHKQQAGFNEFVNIGFKNRCNDCSAVEKLYK